ncbi:MAG: UbiX family flavin prenyltransferase [Chitinophagales bacterium]|nr:UbiX family flavin prenyltransferase [Bacteroidota bacterium]MBP8753921.1 UbiX family flavin prenyltransferase [Chitinophagales bacterium]MBK8487518.1 UbiX family flavin prenyltransferase [Bacteroidota bacterium]MBP9189827.1 UbiX family flavin prenyltransferase [Chitinophagales bacterium]MBP9549942.1 UbiX family flavin prenyltransferase [Chitinophagales bacterium]
MTDNKRRIIVSVSGASGAIYAKVLFDKLLLMNDQIEKIGIVMSDNAKDVWQYELDNRDFENYPFHYYDKNDFMAPFASGSAKYDTLFICPCSMGTLGRIATGVSNDLTTRAADVILKERRKLILLIRETPYNLIHIRNMETVTMAGGIICPASPSYYSKPKNFEELTATVIDRALELAGLSVNGYRWGGEA